MKKVSFTLLSLLIVLFLFTGVQAADKAAIKKNVDKIVTGINSGKKAGDFKAGDYTPYAFIMEEGGKLLVHPSLSGKSLKEKAPPVYNALVKATRQGVWVDYTWKGKKKHSYVRKTKGGLIGGSGYSE